MITLTPGSTEVLLWLGGLCLAVCVLVIWLRRQLHQRNAGTPASRTKAAGTDVFALSSSLHRLALCVAVGLSILAINWTQKEAHVLADFSIEMDDDFDEVIPATAHPKPPPPPPPPPPPTIETVDEPEVEPPAFVDRHAEVNDAVTTAPPKALAKPKSVPPPPPPPPKPADNAPVIFAERMPVFSLECQGLPTEAERKACSDRALLQFIGREVRYPSIARENNISGRVTLQFTVEKDGRITDISVMRGQGGGLSEEALRVIELIDLKSEGFSPGKQQGKPVRVRYTVPILFKLE